MSKRAPSTTQLLVIAGFALSCFGILLFLWVTFGGPTPFRAKPYEIKVPFNEATQLAEQSDVRISGVNVGKVRSIALAPNGKQALATVDIDDKYAPLPESTRAILRTKTLLGETYIELTPGDNEGPELADGGVVPEANVAESVQLDEIFRTFDPETRAAFQSWMQEAAVAINGQGQSLSYAIGEFEPTFTDFDKLFRVLDSQRVAIGQLFRNGATTFQALRGREGELASLIQSSNAVFQTTAQRDRDIEALFRAFPTFQDESRVTLDRLKAFALNADPLFRQLVPAAEQLSPTLIALANLAPEAKGFFEGLSTVIARAPTGFPALRKLFRDDFPPLLRAVDPFLRNLNPIFTGLNLYKHEFTSFFANVAAAANGELTTENAAGEKVHFLRVMSPLNPESLSTLPKRLTTNRNSAYSPPQWAEGLASGLPGFDTRQCSSGITATLNPETAKNEAFIKERTKKGDAKEAEDFFNRLKKFAFAEQSSSSSIPAPGCTQQPPLEPIYGSGPATTYQHAFEQTGQP
ncbi:MAG TPA: MlaD family protein [Solirubrobacterales bacterium]|jgi:ABC-type transporter Mla subunit MlaD|nr:MlaD family protein [Solirubrobacterales bacterium]